MLDKELVLTVVQQNGYALRFAAKELQFDKEVVLKLQYNRIVMD